MRKCSLQEAMREGLLPDYSRWCATWETWEQGEQNHNVNVWDERECPVCLDNLFMVRKPDPEDISNPSIWVCLSCGTWYHDMLSEHLRSHLMEHLAEVYHQAETPRTPAPARPPFIPRPTPQPEKPAPASVDIRKKYRNLIN